MIEGRLFLETSNAEIIKRLAKICSVCLVVVSDILVAPLNASGKVNQLIEVQIGRTRNSFLSYQIGQDCDKFVVLSHISELEDIEVNLIDLLKFFFRFHVEMKHFKHDFLRDGLL